MYSFGVSVPLVFFVNVVHSFTKNFEVFGFGVGHFSCLRSVSIIFLSIQGIGKFSRMSLANCLLSVAI